MRLTLSLILHEWRVQWRSWRFRGAAALYLAICTAPAVVIFLAQRRRAEQLGGATYAADLFIVQPLATALLSVVLAAEAMVREHGRGMWQAISTMEMGSAAYLLRRFLAVMSVALALSLVPVAATLALAAAAGAPPPAWSNVFDPWLLQVLPVTVAFSAMALGFCTIADGLVAGMVEGVLALLLLSATGNRLLAPFARHLASPAAWLGIDRLVARIGLWADALRGGVPAAVAASEGGFDAAAAVEQWLTPASLLLAAGAAALAVAVGYLRRCQRDFKPWRVTEGHALGSLIGIANRLRVRFTPDAWPTSAERAVRWAGVAACAAAVALYAVRDGALREEAARRTAVELGSWPAPSSAAIAPTLWQVIGRLEGDGRIDTRVRAGLRNNGQVPEGRVAFSLNPRLRLAALGSTRGVARGEQRWDRLEIRLSPPLAAGEERFLEMELVGRPAQLRPALPAPALPFFARWQYLQTHRLVGELTDLSTSYHERAVSPRRIELAASDLLPVPRYTSWQLEPRHSLSTGLPSEELVRELDLRLQLTAPQGVFLADSCGDWTAGGRPLAGGCRTALNDFTVRGARAAAVRGAATALALLPQHSALGPAYLASLQSIAADLPHAWPGLAQLGRPVLLEWSPAFDLDPRSGLVPWRGADAGLSEADFEAHGALLLVPESLIARSAPLAPNRVLAELVSGSMLRRRALADNQRFAVAALVRALVARRLGEGPETGAVLTLPGWEVPVLELPLLDRRSWRFSTWTARLDALAADLSARVGDNGLVAGLAAFVSRPEGGGTMKELLGDLEHASGAPLGGFYRDFCKDGALPKITLADIQVARRALVWSVSGRLQNLGTGEVVCPVVLSTDLDRVDLPVRVGSRGSVPFELTTTHQPQSVQLDPDQVCHRYRPLVPGALIEYVAIGAQG